MTREKAATIFWLSVIGIMALALAVCSMIGSDRVDRYQPEPTTNG